MAVELVHAAADDEGGENAVAAAGGDGCSVRMCTERNIFAAAASSSSLGKSDHHDEATVARC